MNKLKAGDKAPAINATDQDGNKITLDSLRGRKVVLYFYPKDDTPGCTAEACSIRDNYRQLLDQNYSVIGVSPDNQKSHQKFAEKHELPFPLLVDTDKKVIMDYGVWGPKKFMGKSYEGVLRTTFLIDTDGNIKHVYENVRPAEHSAELLKELLG